jgi:hypothetical protein
MRDLIQGPTPQAYRGAVLVTPSDTEDLGLSCNALWVGGAGDIEIITVADATPVVLEAVPAGTLLPIKVRRVLAGNTSVTADIVALY